jgi:hypothetical protein
MDRHLRKRGVATTLAVGVGRTEVRNRPTGGRGEPLSPASTLAIYDRARKQQPRRDLSEAHVRAAQRELLPPPSKPEPVPVVLDIPKDEDDDDGATTEQVIAPDA